MAEGDTDTSSSGAATGSVQDWLAALRAQLTPLASIRTTDPEHIGIEVDNTPDPAKPTQDNHRITFFIPQPDETCVSFGMQAPAPRINDTGITGRTKTHVHWHAKEPATILLLGVGSNESWGEGMVGGKNNIRLNIGFMTVTEGHSWIESKQHFNAVSAEGNATLRSSGDDKRVVVQADKGDLNLVAKNAAFTCAPVIALSAPAAVAPNVGVNYLDAWEGEVPEAHASENGARAGAIAAAANAAHELAMAFIKTRKAWKDGKRNPGVKGVVSALKWITEAGEGIQASADLISTMSEAKPKGGSIKIEAAKSVSIVAGSTAELAAVRAVAISSGVWATVAAGVSASLKAVGFVGMSAAVASITGIAKVEIECAHGDIDIEASKGINIDAEGADLNLGSHHSVHISSEKHAVTVGGKTSVTLASGESDGFGMMATSSFIKLGKIASNAEHVSKASFDDKHGIAQTEKLMTITMGDTMLALSDSDFVLCAGSARRIKGDKNGNIAVDSGGKILIG